MKIARWVVAGVLLWALIAAASLCAETPGRDRQNPPPPPMPGSTPSERDIFVPLWTEPLGPEKKLPATVERRRADYVWTNLALRSGPAEPAMHPENLPALLLEFRRSVAKEANGKRAPFVALIRIGKAGPAGTRPLLEIIDAQTLLQSRAWGRLVRQTRRGSEWLFVVSDPMPPMPNEERNPISARVDLTPDINRRFELHLVSAAPSKR